MDHYEYLRVDDGDHGARTVTINRPEARNAIPLQGWGELCDAIASASRDRDVRSLVITGTEGAFAAGDDIKEVALLVKEALEDKRSLMDVREITLLIQESSRLIFQCPKPVIAAVNGWALGAGFELALVCDFAYAAESARFGFPEAGIGMTVTGGISKIGPHVASLAVLKELVFTGRKIDAQEALRLGLVSRVVADDELLPTVGAVTEEIAANSPTAVGLLKKSFHLGIDGTIAQTLDMETELVLASLATQDSREGVLAFGDKRAPYWTGR